MQFDHFGAAVAARFQLYLANLLTTHASHAALGTGTRIAGDFRNAGYALLIVMGNDVRKLLRDYLFTVPQGSRAARTEGFEKHLDRIAQQPIVALAHRLQFGAPAIGQLLTRESGIMGHLIARRLAKPPVLTVQDSAGRAWQPEKLVAFLARDFAYQTHIEHQIGQMQLDGIAIARVTHPDPAHRHAGMRVLLERIEPLRPILFHPNARATLAPDHHVPR